MAELKIRLAQASDKEAVLAFCQKLPDNYIPLVWDKWISDPKGLIFIVTIDDIPVAMERVLIVSKKEAYWEGLRVDPSYQDQGLSKILEACINQYLYKANICVSRCYLLSDNKVWLCLPNIQQKYSFSPATNASLQEGKNEHYGVV
jgi:GNAT superfamily N-acetyltransferase